MMRMQKIMSNLVIIPIPTFRIRHNGITECKMSEIYKFRRVNYSMKSIPSFINLCSVIHTLLNTYKRFSVHKTSGYVTLGSVNDALAQSIMGNGVINPPHDLKQPSR
jgi:hypothetical protein